MQDPESSGVAGHNFYNINRDQAQVREEAVHGVLIQNEELTPSLSQGQLRFPLPFALGILAQKANRDIRNVVALANHSTQVDDHLLCCRHGAKNKAASPRQGSAKT